MARKRMIGNVLQGVGRALSGGSARTTTARTTARRPATRPARTRPARSSGVPRSGRGLLRRFLG